MTRVCNPRPGFDEALEVVLKHEGGYVNHPRDPGGITNLGVTIGTWSSWLGRPATDAEMRNLTPRHVAPLYEKRYWKPVVFDGMDFGIALQVFDFGVNAGPRRARRLLQKAVGTVADGIYGPMTKRAFKKYIEKHGERKLIERYAELRMGYYKRLKHFKTFGRGWTRRTNDVRLRGLQKARS